MGLRTVWYASSVHRWIRESRFSSVCGLLHYCIAASLHPASQLYCNVTICITPSLARAAYGTLHRCIAGSGNRDFSMFVHHCITALLHHCTGQSPHTTHTTCFTASQKVPKAHGPPPFRPTQTHQHCCGPLTYCNYIGAQLILTT